MNVNDQSEEKPSEEHITPIVSLVPNLQPTSQKTPPDNNGKDNTEKDVEIIHGLLSGKVKSADVAQLQSI